MKLIVGLGNPGLSYKNTRHNIGFMFLDAATETFNLDFKLKNDFFGKIYQCKYNNQDVIFLKPMTYMNDSGKAVNAILKYYKIDVNDILVIHDDLDLPVGKIRIRANGTSGGQKGMNSIINYLGTSEIKRIRIGIDKEDDVVNHVLGKFLKEEKIKIDETLVLAPMMIKDYLSLSFDGFMNKYNHNGK